MSVVTNVILSFSILEDELDDGHWEMMSRINDWLMKNKHVPFGVELDGFSDCRCVGGEKNIEAPVFVAAFNYFATENFLEFIFSLPWREPENVQVFVQEQEEHRFTLEVCKKVK